MKKYIIIILLFSVNLTFAQKNVEFMGVVIDSVSAEKINFATIQLVDDSTNELKCGVISDTLGRFKINKVERKKYKLIISCIGYETKKIHLDLSNKRNYYYLKIYLIKGVKQLDEIEITAKQAGKNTNIDKIVFVPDSISLRNCKTGLDVLKKAPGVSVRRTDQAIKVMGNPNVLVLIDGATSNKDISSLSPKDIESIEVINNPSAKYDSDVANVVNVVLKEERKKGLKISTSLTYFHGEDYRSFNTFNIEYEFYKMRIFGTYKFRFNDLSSTIDTTVRQSLINSVNYENITNSYDNLSKMLGHTAIYGFDYKINKKNFLNFTGKYEMLGFNDNWNYLANYFENKKLMSNSTSNSDRDRENILQNYTLLYKRKFDKKSQELTFNTNVYLMNRQYDIIQKTKISHTDGSTTNSDRKTKTTNDNISINSKLDYSHPFSKKIYTDIGTQLYYRNIDNENRVNDKMSEFNYKDLRSALYLVGTIKGEKLSFQTGVRAEKYDIQIYDTVKFSQWNYLPNVSLLYKLNSKNKLKISLNEKLKYPRFQMLIPFTYYSNDSSSVSSGNPYLRPEKFLNLELNYSYKNKHNFISSSIFYRKSRDLIGINTDIHSDNVLQSKYDNIAYSDKIGGYLYFNSFLFNGGIQLSVYNSLYYNTFPDKQYNGLTYSGYLSLELELPFEMFLLIDASYTGREYSYNGYFEEKPIIDEISITKSILKDRGEITLGLSEYFIPYETVDKTWNNNYTEKNTLFANNKAIILSFNYFFRKGKKLKKIEKELNMEKDDK